MISRGTPILGNVFIPEMLGIPFVRVFSAPAQIVNVMQFGNRSNIEDVKVGSRQGGQCQSVSVGIYGGFLK